MNAGGGRGRAGEGGAWASRAGFRKVTDCKVRAMWAGGLINALSKGGGGRGWWRVRRDVLALAKLRVPRCVVVRGIMVRGLGVRLGAPARAILDVLRGIDHKVVWSRMRVDSLSPSLFLSCSLSRACARRNRCTGMCIPAEPSTKLCVNAWPACR